MNEDKEQSKQAAGASDFFDRWHQGTAPEAPSEEMSGESVAHGADEVERNADTPPSQTESATDAARTALPPEARQALVSLLRRGVLLMNQKPRIFAALCRHRAGVEQHLADMYLRLSLDEQAGLAFIRQVDEAEMAEGDEGDDEMRSLITRRALPLYDTLMLLVLRKHYQDRETAGEQRIIIDVERLEAYLTPFLPLTNSERGDRQKLSGALKRMVERRLLVGVRGDESRFEITPVIRYVVNAEFLENMLSEYQRLAREAGVEQSEVAADDRDVTPQPGERMDHELQEGPDTLFSIGQIRLAELSVYNWGSFDGLHTAPIDPEGTLITGDNGSGKSTLIDGLMALLLPAGKATFNVAAAQGDRSDRSLLTYMRGSFGSAHDGSNTRVKSKREGAVMTGLRALYRGDDGSFITLAALFWITQSSNALADVTRLYVVARRNLSLKELLEAFGQGNARQLKQQLKTDNTCSAFDHFTDYQETYRRLLHMDNRNAPALLSRALGLKKIDDLTGLIRELVLEPGRVREDARRVVEEFGDLVATHDQLRDARERRDHLARLPGLSETLAEADTQMTSLQQQREGLPVYLGEVCAALWRDKVDDLQARSQALQETLGRLARRADEAEQTVESRYRQYLAAGGERQEMVRRELKDAQQKLAEVGGRASEYQRDVKALGLDPELSEAVFTDLQAKAKARLADMDNERRAAQDRFAEVSASLGNLQHERRQQTEALSLIEARPDSNIDSRFQRLRDEMAQALDLESGALMFIGELVDVKDDERDWQGAIERALGGLRTTLAVPHESYSMVTRWLNQRHTGLHVRVQVVPAQSPGGMAAFREDGFLRKLIWRDHPYRDWLKHHLSRFDLHCVDNTEVLDATPFSMTRQGLIHKEKGRFEKQDQHRIDDRLSWQLGFSNQQRLTLLRQQLESLESRIAESEQAAQEARGILDDMGRRENLWRRLQDYRWEQINASTWEEKCQVRNDLAALEQNAGDLGQAREQWEAAKQAAGDLRREREAALSTQGELESELRNAVTQRDTARRAAEPGLDDTVREQLAQRIRPLQDSDLTSVQSIEIQHRSDIDQQLENWRERRERAGREATGCMSSFRQRWDMIAGDWGADLASLEDYLAHLEHLEQEGLPALVEEFRERLNKHATQSLARIQQRLDGEREEIIERIETVNRVLARTEFRQGSHLRLGQHTEHYPHVQDFRRQLQKALAQATSDDHEARFRQLAQVVEVLDKASTPASAHTLESLRLLDPRYQMNFYAEEVDTTSGDIRDVLRSSSGKSGGEKESFAGTVVAASLAYVLTPDGYDRPVYSTVFLDEAFSNTAEAVSRRVLRVFRELHIHVNLITPYKNLNLARESARSLLIAERDEQHHESRLYEVSWEEIDRLQAQARQRRVEDEADTLGIQLLS